MKNNNAFPKAAYENLKNHQGQCDMDGIMCEVSRQALHILLDYVENTRPQPCADAVNGITVFLHSHNVTGQYLEAEFMCNGFSVDVEKTIKDVSGQIKKIVLEKNLALNVFYVPIFDTNKTEHGQHTYIADLVPENRRAALTQPLKPNAEFTKAWDEGRLMMRNDLTGDMEVVPQPKADVERKFFDLKGAISRTKNKYIDEGDAKTNGADLHDVIVAASKYYDLAAQGYIGVPEGYVLYSESNYKRADDMFQFLNHKKMVQEFNQWRAAPKKEV